MYYYQHNIGDFDKATRHLTRVERSVYRDLIELYYDTEMQLNADIRHLCRKILAQSNEEVTAVEQVLNEFFTKTESGWYHDRCEAEIERYHSNVSQRSEAGKKSAAARKEKRQRALNKRSTVEQREPNEAATNQEPINNKPLNKLLSKFDFSGWPAIPSEKLLSDWISIRKAKKAPLTQTALNMVGKEMQKAVSAGWTVEDALSAAVGSGWQGFKFEWLQNLRGNQHAKQTGFSPAANKHQQLADWSSAISARCDEQLAELQREKDLFGENGSGCDVPYVPDVDERLY